MTLLLVLLTIAVVAGVAAVLSGWVSGGLTEPVAQIAARGLPSGPLTGDDVATLRFGQGLRGYRMDQVDAVLDGLAAEIERLRDLLPPEVRDHDDRLRVDAEALSPGSKRAGPASPERGGPASPERAGPASPAVEGD